MLQKRAFLKFCLYSFEKKFDLLFFLFLYFTHFLLLFYTKQKLLNIIKEYFKQQNLNLPWENVFSLFSKDKNNSNFGMNKIIPNKLIV